MNHHHPFENNIITALCTWRKYRSISDWPSLWINNGLLMCILDHFSKTSNQNYTQTLSNIVAAVSKRSLPPDACIDMLNIKSYLLCFPSTLRMTTVFGLHKKVDCFQLLHIFPITSVSVEELSLYAVSHGVV